MAWVERIEGAGRECGKMMGKKRKHGGKAVDEEGAREREQDKGNTLGKQV